MTRQESPTERAIREFTNPGGTLADRLGHQSVWKFKGDGRTVQATYAEHARSCDVCRDLDAGGNGLGGRR